MRDNLEKAEELLAPLAVEESSELLLLKAELSYRKRDILAVAEALARLKTMAINDTTRELVDSWIGKGSPE
jgi:predicted metal-dependent TIM-barrel fold hydrolase